MAWFKLNHICETTLYLSICASSTFAMAITKRARQEKYQILSFIIAKINQQRVVIKIRILVQQSKPEFHIYLLAFSEIAKKFQKVSKVSFETLRFTFCSYQAKKERMWFQAVLDIACGQWVLSSFVTVITQEQDLQSEFASHCFTNYEKMT